MPTWKGFALLALAVCGSGCSRTPDASAGSAVPQANAIPVADENAAGRRQPVERVSPSAAPGRPSRPWAAAAEGGDFHFDRVAVEPIEQDWLPVHVVVGDVTGDRRPDVVMSMGDNGSVGYTGEVQLRIYVQQPDGSLASPEKIRIQGAMDPPHSLALAQLDADGTAEIVVHDQTGLTVVSRSGEGFTMAWTPGRVRSGPIAAVDANGDRRQDIFVQGIEMRDGADIFLGSGRGGIGSVSHLDTPFISPYGTGEASDFTGDGLPDVVIFSGYLVRVFPYEWNFGLREPIEVDVRTVQETFPAGGTVADMDDDGRPDLVLSDRGDNGIPLPKGIHVHYRGPDDGFSHSTFLETNDSIYMDPSVVRVADVDRNGYPDIVTMFDHLGLMGYILQGPSGFDPAVYQSTDDIQGTGWYRDDSFAIADVNSDWCPDVVLAEPSSSLVIFYGRNCRVPVPRTGGPLPPVRR
ncbi:MAG TPA: VCBS repeat-containing protein [Xanthomonadaceae bacterium]|nr:VCBS repeat-containing protein [Xanthomonadaceae bacterium]